MVPSKPQTRNAQAVTHHARHVTAQTMMTVPHAETDFSSTKENVSQYAHLDSSETKQPRNANLVAIHARPVVEAAAIAQIANQDSSYTITNA